MMPSDADIDRREILSMGNETDVKEAVHQAVYALWEVVDNLTRLRPTRHKHYRVTLFGSSRVPSNTILYTEVRRLARELATMGCAIVTGGGPGLMEAANEGALQGDSGNQGLSIGLSVAYHYAQHLNPHVRKAHAHRTFFSRLQHFVIMSDAFVAVPGGIGTFMEVMMIWQVMQAQNIHDTPLILVGPMWAELLDWARTHMLEVEVPMVADADLTIPVCVSGVDEAVAILREAQEAWSRSASQWSMASGRQEADG
jgi:uncharacterized protein (TIGR00730 family)